MKKPKRRWIFVAAHCFICVVRRARFLLQQMVPDFCCGMLLVKFPFSLIETNPQLREILDAFQAKMGARLSKEIALDETKSGVAFTTVSLLLGVSGRQTTRPRPPHARCALHRSPHTCHTADLKVVATVVFWYRYQFVLAHQGSHLTRKMKSATPSLVCPI